MSSWPLLQNAQVKKRARSQPTKPNPAFLKKLIRSLPKAELHLHIEGTLEPELMLELARTIEVKIPYSKASEVRSAYGFAGLGSFLDIYSRAMGTRSKRRTSAT